MWFTHGMTASEHIDQQIADTPDWRGRLVAKLRRIIHEADPDIVEEWKWDTGIFTHNGLVCAVGIFQKHVKINFFKGFKLQDKDGLINAGLESKQHRSIDFQENSVMKENKLKDLIREAVALNTLNE